MQQTKPEHLVWAVRLNIWLQVVERARTEDLNRQVRYSVAFVRNREGRVITDVRGLLCSAPSPHNVLICP